MTIHTIPILQDNYAYLIVENQRAVAIDPGEPGPILKVLNDGGLVLEAVWLTHSHYDHVAGCGELERKTGCLVVQPHDFGNTPDNDRLLEGQRFSFFPTPGHCPEHIAIYHPSGHLFCGDSLFIGGCGRLLSGTAREMWQSLQRIAALPPETRLYCGHEYTLDNLEFAASILSGDPNVNSRLTEVRKLRAANRPTVPGILEQELRTNIFLRASDPAVAAALGMAGATPEAVFTECRRRKDSW